MKTADFIGQTIVGRHLGDLRYVLQLREDLILQFLRHPFQYIHVLEDV